jgi:hypothetical protein
MPAAELAALLAYATAMAFTPGPNTTLSTAMAANHGLRHAMRFVLAVPFGWCLLLVACAAGLGTLVTTMPALAAAIRVVGAAYMLWLAWRLARRVAPGVAGAGGAAQGSLDVGFARGVALQFVNIQGLAQCADHRRHLGRRRGTGGHAPGLGAADRGGLWLRQQLHLRAGGRGAAALARAGRAPAVVQPRYGGWCWWLTAVLDAQAHDAPRTTAAGADT